MTSDPLSTWLGFLASPAAPRTAMLPMELDGYLTGIVVAPDMILPSEWFVGLWGEDEPVFDNKDQVQTVMGAVMDRYNAIIAAIDAGLKKLETKQPIDYRPLFLASDSKPRHDVVRTWVRGFAKAMALAPEAWGSLVEDERMRVLIAPFVGFMDVKALDLDPADNVDELLDEAAAAIPRMTLILRKLAQIRSARPRAAVARASKHRRNTSCPCGSGRKYKRCCGAN